MDESGLSDVEECIRIAQEETRAMAFVRGRTFFSSRVLDDPERFLDENKEKIADIICGAWPHRCRTCEKLPLQWKRGKWRMTEQFTCVSLVGRGDLPCFEVRVGKVHVTPSRLGKTRTFRVRFWCPKHAEDTIKKISEIEW